MQWRSANMDILFRNGRKSARIAAVCRRTLGNFHKHIMGEADFIQAIWTKPGGVETRRHMVRRRVHLIFLSVNGGRSKTLLLHKVFFTNSTINQYVTTLCNSRIE